MPIYHTHISPYDTLIYFRDSDMEFYLPDNILVSMGKKESNPNYKTICHNKDTT